MSGEEVRAGDMGAGEMGDGELGHEETGGEEGWVLHVVETEGARSPGAAGSSGDERSSGAGARRGLRRSTVRVGSGGWLRAAADAVRIARRLCRRPDPAGATVRWPEAGPVPVLHAHDAPALRAAWLALCLSGAPARLTALWDEGATPADAGIWRRCDLALAGSPAAARALMAAGLAGRRIRVLGEAASGDPGDSGSGGSARAGALLAVYRELWSTPLARTRRVDWSLR